MVSKKVIVGKLEALVKKVENKADPQMLKELIKLESQKVDKNGNFDRIYPETIKMYDLVLENNSFNFREFISRSKEYLKNNEQLSKEDFDQLFK
jgi:hypothetical protein